MPMATGASSSSSSSNTDDFGEKDQIRAATLLSLNNNSDRRGDLAGRDKGDLAAEALSRQYREYNLLDYEEKVVDGFYDVYGLSTDSATQGKMPSLSHIEANPGSSDFEVVLVNRTIDPALEELLQDAQRIALDVPATDVHVLVQKLAVIVAGYMGGPVKDANMMFANWSRSNRELRRSLHTNVLPIGSLYIGLSRHRALLFKVLADCTSLPCRLIKGILYTGGEYDAVSIIKLNDEREFLVDLMAAPGTLTPADSLSAKDTVFKPYPIKIPALQPKLLLGEGSSQNTVADGNFLVDRGSSSGKIESLPSFQVLSNETAAGSSGLPSRVTPSQLDNLSTSVVGSSVYKGGHQASTVGDAVRMNLDADFNPFQFKGTGKTSFLSKPAEIKVEQFQRHRNNLVSGRTALLMMLKKQNRLNEVPRKKYYHHKEGILAKINREPNNYNLSSSTSTSSTASEKFYLKGLKPSGNANLSGKDNDARNCLSGSGSLLISSISQPNRPPVPKMRKNQNPYDEVPGKRDYNYKEDILPKINREPNNYNLSLSTSTGSTASEMFYPHGLKPSGNANLLSKDNDARNALSGSRSLLISSTNQPNRPPLVEDSSTNFKEGNHGDGEDVKFDMLDMVKEHENKEIGYHDRRKCTNDRFMGSNLKLTDQESQSSSVNSSTNRVDQVFDDVDVSECEIPWEDLDLGERIGIGSYGEVYLANWNGTEVAVKKLLDQNISGATLLEFKREVKIMRRLCHPNIVIFMGAVIRPPNLSIISEFLPRGSLFTILHHPQCQIDEKCRIKMALDVARGMNCLHTSTPTIVHRDLKSPNLLVDKNWNVKVCDFGLSRLKHTTFLSSKSAAGSPGWAAPEVLRCERSNEKCDVYSFGVILWELATLRMPWTEMNPMQVIGAVGFQNRRLEIPKEVDPSVARIIHECWQTDPNLRPSFAELIEALKRVQRLVIPSHLDQPSSSLRQEISEKPDAVSEGADTSYIVAESVCRSCSSDKTDIAILPCGHAFCVCHRCSFTISRCRVCRR